MLVLFLFANIVYSLHYSVALQNQSALIIPYYAQEEETIEYTFVIHSADEELENIQWGLEFGEDGQCQYDKDLFDLKEENNEAVIHGQFETKKIGQWYFRICPGNYAGVRNIYGDLHVKGSTGYANAFDFNIVQYNLIISIIYILLLIIWSAILLSRQNVRSHHHMLTSLVLLTAATHWMTVLKLYQYNEYGYATSDAWAYMLLILQSVRNVMLVMYAMQTCSGWGMLYTEWSPLTYQQVFILIGFFIADFTSTVALEIVLLNENSRLYISILIFRHLFVLTAVCVYTTIKMDESSDTQERIQSDAKGFYSKVSTLIVFILSASCAVLTSGLLYAKYEGNMYNFWIFQYGWIDIGMLVFLIGLLHLYQPSSSQNVFYKGMDLDSMSHSDLSVAFATPQYEEGAPLV